MTPLEWLFMGEVGISSKTMCAAILDQIPAGLGKGFDFDVPHDPDDFRRCFLFVQLCRISNKKLQIIKKRIPWYAPIIDNWNELVILYGQESPNNRCPKLYDRLIELENECMILDGWKKMGSGSWEREDAPPA